MKFKVNDRVKVINKFYTYSKYETWINKCAMQYKKNGRKKNYLIKIMNI